MFLWGGVTVCTAAVNSYEGLYAQRFFLGFAEASVSPAFSLITVMWYKRSEVPLRYAIWYSAAGLGVLVGSLILYAIGQVVGPLAPWRYQFIVIGSITSLWAVVLFFILPDNPIHAYFLTQRQRVVAVERLRADQVGIENKTVKREQIIETLTDIKTYWYMIMVFAINLTNGAATGFGSIIVQSFGASFLRIPQSRTGLTVSLVYYTKVNAAPRRRRFHSIRLAARERLHLRPHQELTQLARDAELPPCHRWLSHDLEVGLDQQSYAAVGFLPPLRLRHHSRHGTHAHGLQHGRIH